MTVPSVSPWQRSDRRRSWLRWMLMVIWMATLGAFAAGPSNRRRFDVPAGEAEVTLRRFTSQADVELVYSIEKVAGISTNPVKGEFTVREALDLMIANTPLTVVRDTQTGALLIKRAAPSKPRTPPTPFSQTPPTKESPPENQKGNTMTPKSRVAWLASMLALIVAPEEPLPAQTVSATSETSSSQKDDEILRMSPFVVSSTQDTGYLATSTLAGTRLNTPLKDLGSAISVYTKDFLDDLGATTANDLLIYSTAMEAGGPGGNFSAAGLGGGGGATSDILGSREVTGEDARVDPQSSSRTRGLATPNFTRGLAATDIPTDSYNIESVTVNRGPNASLFGTGSPVGVIESTLLRPDLQLNKNKVEVRVGNNSSLRESVDFNRVLIKRKLGLRVAALHDRDEFNQRPAFEEKKRIYGALSFEPFPTTQLRGNFETGRTRANRPITVLPYFSVSRYWFDQGRPTYDWTFYDDPARNPSAAAQNAANATGFLMGLAGAQLSSHIIAFYNNPTDRAPAYGLIGNTRSTNGTAADSVRTGIFQPDVNRDLAADNIGFTLTRNISELPNGFWTGDLVPPGQLPNFAPAYIKSEGFTDFSAFDFKNRMIDETSLQSDSFHAFNLTFEQRGWGNRVGLELVYDSQRADRHSLNSFFSTSVNSQIRIDTNVTLPNGKPNPNLGRPYALHAQYPWRNYLRDRENMRATAFLRYDFKDLRASWGHWLGRHSLTMLAEKASVDDITYSHRLTTEGAAAVSHNPAIQVDARRPRAIVYLGPSLVGNNNPVKLSAIQLSPIKAGLTLPVSYFSRPADATSPGGFVESPVTFRDIFSNGTASRDVIQSKMAVLQSYWLREHLITVVGWRRDEDHLDRRVLRWAADSADPTGPGKVHYGFDDFSFPNLPPENAAKEVMSYSAVLNWPQKLFKLPLGAEFSVFFNTSENFTPTGGRIDLFGKPLGSPEGKTKDAGFNLSAFQGKLNLRFNKYENSLLRSSYLPQAFVGAWTAVTDRPGQWLLEGNFNPHLVAQRQADIDLLLSALPPNFFESQLMEINGTAPNLSYSRVAAPGTTDTTDFTSKGIEIEVVYNPTRNWRILANVARQEAKRTNSLPFLKQFVETMLPIWNQLRDRPSGNYPIGWQPGDPLPANIATYGQHIDNQVLIPMATELAIEGVSTPEVRKWRANFVTRYAFGRDSIFGEWLNGWSIGGALRWQDKGGIGYPTSRNLDGSANVDVAHPYYAPSQTNIDAFVTYERRIWKNRINWKLQLNVRNLYGDDDTIPIAVQPWGEISTVRLAPERRWYLTNTFAF